MAEMNETYRVPGEREFIMCAIFANQHHYLSLRTITYREDFIGRFVTAYACDDWTAFRSDNTVKEIAFEWKSTRYIIHKKMPAIGKLSPELNCVLQDVIKVINHIKVHALNLRLFDQLCEKMDAEHKRFLLYREIRWLSRGKTLTWVFDLRGSLQRFLQEKELPLTEYFSNPNWVPKLAYLSDINVLNELNLSQQGKMSANIR